jgi:hypothetical protein
MGSSEPALAFATRTFEQPALEIRVNFGLFAGREATPAEIDSLAAALKERVDELTIVSEARHELSGGSEATIRQVRIEVSPQEIPSDEHELDELCGRLIEIAERWTRECASERHIEPIDL